MEINLSEKQFGGYSSFVSYLPLSLSFSLSTVCVYASARRRMFSVPPPLFFSSLSSRLFLFPQRLGSASVDSLGLRGSTLFSHSALKFYVSLRHLKGFVIWGDFRHQYFISEHQLCFLQSLMRGRRSGCGARRWRQSAASNNWPTRPPIGTVLHGRGRRVGVPRTTVVAGSVGFRLLWVCRGAGVLKAQRRIWAVRASTAIINEAVMFRC